MQTFTSKIHYLEKLKLHHIVVTSDILDNFVNKQTKSKYNQRFLITLNGTITWQGGSTSLGDQTAYITISKARMRELDVHLNDEVSVQLELDNSKYGFDVPEEFTAVLEQDDHAKNLFETMSMGKQRAIIYIVLQLKSSDKRIEKTLFLMENLKRAPAGKATMRHVLGKDLD